jgi:zinc/manganese transport system substrate-binding protein
MERRMTKWLLPTAAVLAAVVLTQPAFADPVKIVAAENFYGDIARQVGGGNVEVTSILSRPDQDPHLFEASPSTAKELGSAKIVIANGADYDPWMEKLLNANKAPGRREILAAALVGKKAGDNPHVWYNPITAKALAMKLGADLAGVDPARGAEYEKGAASFVESLRPLEAKIAGMRRKYAGTAVTASEPVFGYMAELLDLNVHNETFALSVMNNTEPSASQVAAFENDLKGRKVKVMLFNAQVSEPAVQRLLQMAKDQKIPIVGVTETEPANMSYQDWMMSQLDALDKALSGAIM